MKRGWMQAAAALAMTAGGMSAAHADRIKNPTAVFSGLDTITGRTVSFEVAINESVQFGSLQMTTKVCYTKPTTETSNTTAFVQVDDTVAGGELKHIFTGWMFAASPGLHGVEHPVYDIWLVDCKGGTEVIAEPKDVVEEPPPVAQTETPRERPSSQSSDIIAPTSPQPAPAAPAAAAPAPAAPIQQPPRPRLPPAGSAPIINNERTNDH